VHSIALYQPSPPTPAPTRATLSHSAAAARGLDRSIMNTHSALALALALALVATVLVSSLDCPGIAVCLAVPAVVVYGPQELFTSMFCHSGILKLFLMNAMAASSLRTSFIRTFCEMDNGWSERRK
jgi:membrane associated rhomboid family serine protease